MRLVRGRAEARWFPSRHNAALFRLYAYLRLRRAAPEPTNTVLAIDRHQSNVETVLTMVWLTATLACYLCATLFASWPIVPAVLVSLPLAHFLVEWPCVVSGLTIAPMWRAITGRPGDSIAVNGTVIMLLFVGASSYFSMHRTWVRFVAWQFFALLLLNAVAAAIVFLLRDSIARLETSIGGAASEP